MKAVKLILIICTILLCNPAHAVLDIKITKGLDSAFPIAIVPFRWSGASPVPAIDVAAVVAEDLGRSGRFAPMPFADIVSRPSDYSEINFKDWRLFGMDHLVVGKLNEGPAGSYEIEFRLIDVLRQKQIAGYKIPANTRTLRLTVHQISDIIYEKLTEERGAFATRVAYVTVVRDPNGKRIYRILLSDADGFNAKTLLESREPLLSPAWSPDGKRIAYVSFEDKNSAIWVQEVRSGKRERVAHGPGINSAPAWSPDGNRLAMTLSRDGNPEIYILHLGTRQLQRLTNHYSIDTEPAWSPDGRKLLFTSDRGGGPQIYEMTLGGGAKRLTYNKGSYNARGRYSPKGDQIAMVHRVNGGFQIAVLDLATDDFQILTNARLDESPSFAPNGSMIIYTTMGARGTELAATSVDGRVKQRLTQQGGEVREPAWGPFRN
jgi:TolB protein